MNKRSNSSKPRLKLIYGGKKDQLRVLVGDIEDNIFQDNLLLSVLKGIYSEKYDIKIRSSEYADEILQLAKNNTFDLYILILNNILVPPGNQPSESCIEELLRLVTRLNVLYEKPIIGLYGWPYDPTFPKQVISAGANYVFPLPLPMDQFIKVVKICL
jgi:hypothetical protein